MDLKSKPKQLQGSQHQSRLAPRGTISIIKTKITLVCCKVKENLVYPTKKWKNCCTGKQMASTKLVLDPWDSKGWTKKKGIIQQLWWVKWEKEQSGIAKNIPTWSYSELWEGKREFREIGCHSIRGFREISPACSYFMNKQPQKCCLNFSSKIHTRNTSGHGKNPIFHPGKLTQAS